MEPTELEIAQNDIREAESALALARARERTAQKALINDKHVRDMTDSERAAEARCRGYELRGGR